MASRGKFPVAVLPASCGLWFSFLFLLCVAGQHFVCAHCEKPFEGRRHFEKKGQAYCERDYKTVSPPGSMLSCVAYDDDVCVFVNTALWRSVFQL